jgi:hypothetical protein
MAAHCIPRRPSCVVYCCVHEVIFGYELHDVGDVDRSIAFSDGPQVDSELAVKLCCLSKSIHQIS